MSDKKRRPDIPNRIRIELWARAAGRCEFRGCNKCLYRDGITKLPRNAAEVAHIISWTPDGPRGNPIDSHSLATDISNLMLTCPEHNALIDDPQYVDQYPVEVLRKYKKEHENRINRLMDLGQDYSVQVIELVSRIQGQVPSITEKDVIDAIIPDYPSDNFVNIDLSSVETIEEAKRKIDRAVDLHLSTEERVHVFVMAKIPYSCYLGYAIGNKKSVEVHQFFRDDQDWKWKKENPGGFILSGPVSEEKSQDVNLFVNVSGVIDCKLVVDRPCYCIQATHPGFMFIQNKEQIIEFRLKFRELLDRIRISNGEGVNVHLFVAAPNPIIFEIGRAIMKNLDPTVILYDKTADGLNYEEVMHLHDRIRD